MTSRGMAMKKEERQQRLVGSLISGGLSCGVQKQKDESSDKAHRGCSATSPLLPPLAQQHLSEGVTESRSGMELQRRSSSHVNSGIVADQVNIQGIKSFTRMLEKWGNSIFWQMKHSLLSHPNTLLPEFSSLRPVSEAIDNLLKQVHSMKKRLAELNERLTLMSRTLFPIRYKALRSQRLSSTPLRRLPLKQKRMYMERRPQRN
ncbi:uncharacterized protein LOC133390554 isoform X2 [Rhineura floridana]|uniref:uncharacterized protein LOC133390554 isoform X2 n=1 Tax=Rhineura floridana TaxID=261503 RepID=UPI002AC8687E|nr:uncharacterized protein LOC133390554 isoform X2 [Rhineura floridana]